MHNDQAAITFDVILRETRKTLSHEGPDDEAVQCAAIMMASAFVGNDPAELLAFTCLPPGLLEAVRARCEAGGIWRGREVDSDPWFEEGGGLTFGMDAGVAAGILTRSTHPGGQPTYGMTDAGRERVEKMLPPEVVAEVKQAKREAGNG